jgi:hypothetical protein
MTPENRGHKSGGILVVKYSAAEVFRHRNPKNSQPEIGEVAVAIRGTGARHQQAINIGHEAGEQGGRGREAQRCGLGHDVPLLLQPEEGWVVATEPT